MTKFSFHFNTNNTENAVFLIFGNNVFYLSNIICYAPTKSLVRETQPRLRMFGYAEKLEVKDNVGYIY